MLSIEKPVTSLSYCSQVIFIASSSFLGQLNDPSVTRFTERLNPSPSNARHFILFFLLPQNRNMVPTSRGSMNYFSLMRDTRPSIPFLISVRPVAITIFLISISRLNMACCPHYFAYHICRCIREQFDLHLADSYYCGRLSFRLCDYVIRKRSSFRF